MSPDQSRPGEERRFPPGVVTLFDRLQFTAARVALTRRLSAAGWGFGGFVWGAPADEPARLLTDAWRRADAGAGAAISQDADAAGQAAWFADRYAAALGAPAEVWLGCGLPWAKVVPSGGPSRLWLAAADELVLADPTSGRVLALLDDWHDGNRWVAVAAQRESDGRL